MGIGATDIGKRLRAAREASGLSTRAAAREAARVGLSVSHATLANYERGDTMPPMETLRVLSAAYGWPIEQILSESPVLEGVRYRALKSTLVRERRFFEGEATRWFHIYLTLETILGKQLRAPKFRPLQDESGAALAKRVRVRGRLGDRPISSVVRLLEAFGVRVINVNTDARIDALAAMFGSTRVVALNSRVPPDRFRFNAAHELGHHLYEDWKDREQGDHGGDDRAHEFASHLLLPDNRLNEALKGFSMVRLVRYKELYGISLAAMVYRARRRGMVSERDYKRIWREFSRLGWRRREPGFVPADDPRRLEQLIEQAVHHKRMKWREIGQIAGVEGRVVRARVMEAIAGSLPDSGEPTEPLTHSWAAKGRRSP